MVELSIEDFEALRNARAREQARKLKRDVDLGGDPLGELLADRQAPTVEDLCLRFGEEHLPKLRPSTRGDCEAYIRRDVLPALGKVKVADVTHAEIDALHRKISKRAPYAANRVASLLSKMFALAIRWRWRADNPAKGTERNQEEKRTRYLSGDEIGRLTAELEKLEDQQAADIIRLLMLTGARSHEVLSMTWSQVDLESGVWTKPGSTTKQKTEHRVPLSEDAIEVVARQPRTGFFVFPGDGKTGHRESVRKPWAKVHERAKLGECRIHDVRHTFASLLASSGESLHVIGKMLGHTQPSTTHRYAHLLDEPLRNAAAAAAEAIRKPKAGKVVRLRK